MDSVKLSVEKFAQVLSSSEPAPGGGGAAAVCAALGCALGEMVGSLTVGKKRYADVEEEIRGLMAECADLRADLLWQVAADAEGFLPLAAAYSIPKDDPSREATLEAATLTACETPIRIMELCCEVIEKISVFAEKGSRIAVSDAGCGAILLEAAMKAASLNVFINTKSLKDREKAAAINRRAEEMLARYGSEAERVFDDVRGKLT